MSNSITKVEGGTKKNKNKFSLFFFLRQAQQREKGTVTEESECRIARLL